MAFDSSEAAVLNRSAKLDGKPGEYDGKPIDFSKAEKAPINIEWLHPSQLFLDREVLVNPRMPWDRLPRLNRIAKKWAWDKFNPMTVAARGTNKYGVPIYAILDGGGGFWIITELKPELKDLLIPCHVVSKARTRVQEAGVFGAQKDRLNPGPRDFFESDHIRKDPDALAIRKAFDKLGMAFPAKWPHGYPSVPLVKAIYNAGDLERTLVMARRFWGEKGKLATTALAALSIILDAHPHLEEDRLEQTCTAVSLDKIIKEIKEQGHCGQKELAGRLAHKWVTDYDYEFRGRLIGGSRIGDTPRKKKYQAGPRHTLEASIKNLLNTWRQSSSHSNEE